MQSLAQSESRLSASSCNADKPLEFVRRTDQANGAAGRNLCAAQWLAKPSYAAK
eukprot:SAG31_NODE_28880_length_404_cov_0.675410_1_plen_53_part_01